VVLPPLPMMDLGMVMAARSPFDFRHAFV